MRCAICNENESKYKCPTCSVRYCSLACYKKHKEIPCEHPAPVTETTPAPAEQEKPLNKLEDEDEKTALTEEQLRSIGTHSDVQQQLSPQIKRIIRDILAHPDPDKAIENARTNEPSFDEFADIILRVVRPPAP